jgi:hypothetical protein
VADKVVIFVDGGEGKDVIHRLLNHYGFPRESGKLEHNNALERARKETSWYKGNGHD